MGEILSDVVGEHLDEATFLFGAWQRAFDSVSYTLSDLANTVEERLRAHIDGLVVGGDEVAGTWLEPLLAGDVRAESDQKTAAALALLESGRFAPVLDSLATDPDTRDAVTRALGVCEHPTTDDWVRSRLAEAAGPARAALLAVAARRQLAGVDWARELASPDPDILTAAAAGVVGEDPPPYVAAIDALLVHPVAPVRDAAVRTAVAWRTPTGWARCWSLLDSETPSPARLLVALIGGSEGHQRLLADLDRGTDRISAITALGFTGSPLAANALLPLLDDSDATVAKAAAGAISQITGFDSTDSRFVGDEPEADGLPSLDEDDLDASLVPVPEANLPMPNLDAIRAYCAETLPRLAPDQRWLAGRPWTPGAAATFLRNGPLYRRHAVALWILLATRGRGRVDTRTFSAVQRKQIAALGLPDGNG